MRRTTLTARQLERLQTDAERLELWDGDVRGLGVRVTSTGIKTFFVRYRQNGAQRRLNLGRYPALTLAGARKRARKILAEVADGADPALDRRSRRSHETTFVALAKEVLAAKATETRPKTRRARDQILHAALLPAWATRPAASITRRDVVLLVERIARRAPVLANRTLSLINLLYNEGLRRGFPTVEANPAHLIRPPGREVGRKRLLTPTEIAAIWHALEPESAITRGVLRMALLTAQRIGATCMMRWALIEGDVWHTPAPDFKGRRDQLVPLSPRAQDILDALRPVTGGGEYVFPGRRRHERPRSSINTAVEHARKRAGIPHWRVHDFRTAFRTHAVRAPEDGGLGIAPNVADAVLGHKEASLGFDRYTGEPERYLLAEKHDALVKWGAFVRCAVLEAR